MQCGIVSSMFPAPHPAVKNRIGAERRTTAPRSDRALNASENWSLHHCTEIWMFSSSSRNGCPCHDISSQQTFSHSIISRR